jgi:hypothetical protein
LSNVIRAQLDNMMADLVGRDPQAYMASLFSPRNLEGESPLFSMANNGNTVRDTGNTRPPNYKNKRKRIPAWKFKRTA